MKSIESLAVVGKPTSTSSLVVQTPESLLQQLAGLQHDLREQVVKSAKDGESFDSTERMVWDMIRKMGYAALELFIAAQGSGDLGEQVVTGEQRELARSEQPTLTTLRSIFGTHSFKQFTYSAGAHRKIELRPISNHCFDNFVGCLSLLNYGGASFADVGPTARKRKRVRGSEMQRMKRGERHRS